MCERRNQQPLGHDQGTIMMNAQTLAVIMCFTQPDGVARFTAEEFARARGWKNLEKVERAIHRLAIWGFLHIIKNTGFSFEVSLQPTFTDKLAILPEPMRAWMSAAQ